MQLGWWHRCRKPRQRPPPRPNHLLDFWTVFAHNLFMSSYRSLDSIRLLLCGACLLYSACGGHSGLASSGAGGTTTIPSGGSTALATGGIAGGATTIPSGGSTTLATGGTGGVSAAGGSTGAPSCVGVICPSLPASCKKIVQDPGACCPTCTDTGCDPCADITCATGTHKETPVGACCPICVADPPDPCTQGQQNYAAFRTSMLDKVGTVKCQNSTDCVLLEENNACGVVCNVALPSSTADSFQSNLSSQATQDCATCPTPASVQCERMVPACMNGRCVAANPS